MINNDPKEQKSENKEESTNSVGALVTFPTSRSLAEPFSCLYTLTAIIIL